MDVGVPVHLWGGDGRCSEFDVTAGDGRGPGCGNRGCSGNAHVRRRWRGADHPALRASQTTPLNPRSEHTPQFYWLAWSELKRGWPPQVATAAGRSPAQSPFHRNRLTLLPDRRVIANTFRCQHRNRHRRPEFSLCPRQRIHGDKGRQRTHQTVIQSRLQDLLPQSRPLVRCL